MRPTQQENIAPGGAELSTATPGAVSWNNLFHHRSPDFPDIYANRRLSRRNATPLHRHRSPGELHPNYSLQSGNVDHVEHKEKTTWHLRKLDRS
jgi:hypothetical protein